MMPTDMLRDEHRVILRALEVLEQAAERLANGGDLPEGWWAELIGWFRGVADQIHHAKEERYLFPAMALAGVPATGGGPIVVMLEEHEEGRLLVQAMASDGEPATRVRAARSYVHLLRAHIDKENGVLLPLADAVLTASAQSALARNFDRVDTEPASAGRSEAEAALERLAKVLG